MVQFKVGYYLFAILFLMFDVETVFLFPWAVIAKGMGVESILAVCGQRAEGKRTERCSRQV